MVDGEGGRREAHNKARRAALRQGAPSLRPPLTAPPSRLTLSLLSAPRADQ